MLEDLSKYEDTKRNEKCPCGSGKIFKKCCMNEYRETRNKLPNIIVSSFSPLPSLSKDEAQEFTKTYENLLMFSHKHKNNSDILILDDIKESMISFLAKERDYFYANREDIIEKFIEQEKPNKNKLLILDAIKDAKFDNFFLLSRSEESAII